MAEMEKKSLVLQGRLLDANMEQQGAIYVKDGIIKRILKPGEKCTDETAIVLNFGDARITPSFIDMFGFVTRDKDLLSMEQQEAAAGGFSHLVCIPTRQLPLDTPESVLWLSRQSDRVRLLPVAGLTRSLEGRIMSQMAKLSQAGALAFSQGRADLDNTRILLNCYEYLSSIGGLLLVSPRDSYLGQGYVAEDSVSWQTGLPAVPYLAETIATSRHLMLIKKAGVRAHFSALSRAESLGILAGSGQQLTADVSLSHLIFTAADLTDYDTTYYIDPPLGSTEERQLLAERAKKYLFIRALSSLHLSLLKDDLEVPVQLAHPGMAIRALFLPLALSLVKKDIFNLQELIRLITSHPADILGLQNGYLKEGNPACICVFDDEKEWTLTRRSYLAANTPLVGKTLTGKVLLTMNEGRVTYTEEGDLGI